MRLRLLLGLLALLALAVPAGAAARSHRAKAPVRRPVALGVADQKPDLFTDPRFLALGVKRARRAIAWDALTSPWQTAELDAWMNAARAAGVSPLLTFDRSRLDGRTRVLPTSAQLLDQFRALRARYPWAREFSAFNEPNFLGLRPETIAGYYRVMRRSCPSCTILGADLLDLPSTPAWVRRFVRVAGQPKVWGFHNYVTANRFQTSRTRALLQATTGQLWLTETGGLVARRNRSLIPLPEGPTHAAEVTRFILGPLAALSPRITRAYLYQWDASSSTDTWDSAFVGPDGKARPALGVLKKAAGIARRATH